MSFCRFSDDNFKSDVYAYESAEGFELHVAGNRVVAHIAAKFNIPAAEVDAGLDAHGCPILAEHVTVSIANPWRWL